MGKRRVGSRWLRVVAAAAIALAVLPLGTAASAAQPDDGIELTRLNGPDRYATSLIVARQFLEDSGGSIDAAVVVSGESWHDAVVAAGLAGKLDAPVLLTPPDHLLSGMADFLAEAGVTRVKVIGSPDAVSSTVLGRLARFGSVERIWRSSPAATSVAVAQRMGTPGKLIGQRPTVFLVRTDVFADGLVSGPPAFRGGHPVLLTSPDALHKHVASYLARSGTEEVIALGGTGALSDQVGDEIVALGMGVLRLSGEDRIGTAVKLSRYLDGKYEGSPGARDCFSLKKFGLASAWNPIHALSAGPLLGKRCTALLLTGANRIPPHVEGLIEMDAKSLVVFGGETAVPSRTLGSVDEDGGVVEGTELQGIFERAASERARIVANLTRNINAGTYGVDDNMLHGPADFEIDLNDCPADWSDTIGITGNEIRIGLTLPKSGQYVTSGNIEWGMNNYLDWVNRNDPVAGRQIRLVTKDDRYDPRQTAAQVDSLIETEDVFSVLTLGTPTTFAVYDRVNEACVPHPFVMSGHPAWGDPVNHPWTTGMQMSASTEAALWGTWIADKFRRELPVTVGALVMDNELGVSYQDAFADWARAHPDVIAGMLAVRHDPAALVFDEEAARIKVYDPDVYISMTSGNPCWRAMQSLGWMGVADEIQSRGGALIMSSLCATPENLHLAGNSGEGWYSAGGGLKEANNPANADDPFIKFVNENLDKARIDPEHPLYGTAYWFAYPYVEALRIAAELPGGLSRTNFILAVRSLDISHPMLRDGIRLRMNGNADAFAVEASEFRRYNARAEAWLEVGPVIDLEGETPNCAWDPEAGTCE